MSEITTPIDSLPNEMLIAVLSTFKSRELLPLTLVNRRFNATATTILQHRLLRTTQLEEHEMMLESYHPSAKLSTPSMSCRFTGVDFLNRAWDGEGDLDLTDLPQLYSRFHPVVSEETRRMRSIFTRRMPGAPAPPEEVGGDEPVVQEILLDEDELFCQLCTTTSLVKAGPRPGMFASHINVNNGVVRVWRQWLGRTAVKSAVAPASGKLQRDDSDILWFDATKNVGIRFHVTQIAQERTPVLHGTGEDPPVSYTVRYEELLVRTSCVLLAMEKSAGQDIVTSGFVMQLDAKSSHAVETVLMAPAMRPLFSQAVAVM